MLFTFWDWMGWVYYRNYDGGIALIVNLMGWDGFPNGIHPETWEFMGIHGDFGGDRMAGWWWNQLLDMPRCSLGDLRPLKWCEMKSGTDGLWNILPSSSSVMMWFTPFPGTVWSFWLSKVALEQPWFTFCRCLFRWFSGIFMATPSLSMASWLVNWAVFGRPKNHPAPAQASSRTLKFGDSTG